MIRSHRALRVGASAAAAMVATVVVIAQSTPAHAVPQWTTVTDTFPTTDQTYAYGNVSCPRPTYELSGGAAIVGDAASKSAVHVAGITLEGTGVSGSGHRHNWDVEPAWSLRVTAICGVVNGWEPVQAAALMTGPDEITKTVSVKCPSNKKVIGAGGANGKPWHMKLLSINPSSNLSSVTVTVTTTVKDDFVAWVKASAICIDPLPTQQLATAYSATNTSNKTVTVTCPDGLTVHGLGGGVTGAGWKAHITRLEPLNASTAVLEASSDVPGPVQGWSAYVHAICAA